MEIMKYSNDDFNVIRKIETKNGNLVIWGLGMGIGDWGLGIGDWGLGMGDWGVGSGREPQSPSPDPQSPIPNPHPLKSLTITCLFFEWL